MITEFTKPNSDKFIFLLSENSKCISGEVIHCNAGNHLKAFWDISN